MGKGLVLAVALVLGAGAAAYAQQTTNGSTPYRGLGTGSPGGAGTAGTTSTTPGAEEKQTVPGGGIQMGAGTQNDSERPANPSNFDSSGGSKRR